MRMNGSVRIDAAIDAPLTPPGMDRDGVKRLRQIPTGFALYCAANQWD
jgi:hypothetical protein